MSKKTKILNVVYNSSNNELVRTNTLVKNTIVRIDAHPFKNTMIKKYYGCDDSELEKFEFDVKEWGKDEKLGNQNTKKFIKRRKNHQIDPKVMD